MTAVLRDVGESHAMPTPPLRELLRVAVPDSPPPRLERVPLLQLTQQEGSLQLGGEVARAHVGPLICAHLSANECRAVRALVADYLGTGDVLGSVQDEGPALARGHVLGFVEAERGEPAEGPEWALPVAPEQP